MKILPQVLVGSALALVKSPSQDGIGGLRNDGIDTARLAGAPGRRHRDQLAEPIAAGASGDGIAARCAQ